MAACAGSFADVRHEVHRIVDLGCGPGVATSQLATAFPTATVLAVDGSGAMLDRAARRAERLGHAGRIATLQLDLNVRAPPNVAAREFVAGRLGRDVRDLATAEPEDIEALSRFVATTRPSLGGAWDDATVTSSRRLLVARPGARSDA